MNKPYSEDLISAFLTCFTVREIARKTGLSKTTVYKYKADPEFNAVLNERRAAIVQEAVNKMSASILTDVDVLQSIINDAGINPAVRISAINLKWSHLREWHETVDTDNRLKALERSELALNGRSRAGSVTQ